MNWQLVTNYMINGEAIYAKILQQLGTGLLYLILK